jgi:hypothetical protein
MKIRLSILAVLFGVLSAQALVGQSVAGNALVFVGPNGQYTDGGVPPGSGGSVANGIVVTTSYTMTGSGTIQLNCGSACNLTLPASPATGFSAGLISIGAGTVTILPNGKTNTGVASLTQGQAVFLFWDGTNYDTGPATASPVADVSVAVPSFAIPANTCYGSAGSTTPTTFAMTGVTTSMKITPGYVGNPTGIVGFAESATPVNIAVWASASGQGSYVICNNNGASVTFGAITFRMGAQ